MGFDLAFFAAADDQDAARAGVRPGGPLGWPTVVREKKVGWFRREPIIEELGPAYDGFATRGYDTVTVEVGGALLRGLAWAEVEDDPRCTADVELATGDEYVGVFTITDGLRDALDESDDDALRSVVDPWMASEELHGPGWEDVTAEEHFAFLVELRALARRARKQGHRLYQYWSD